MERGGVESEKERERGRVVTSFTEVVTTMQRREERGKKAELQRGKVNFCPVNQWASEGEGGVVIRDSGIGLQCSKGLARSHRILFHWFVRRQT